MAEMAGSTRLGRPSNNEADSPVAALTPCPGKGAEVGPHVAGLEPGGGGGRGSCLMVAKDVKTLADPFIARTFKVSIRAVENVF